MRKYVRTYVRTYIIYIYTRAQSFIHFITAVLQAAKICRCICPHTILGAKKTSHTRTQSRCLAYDDGSKQLAPSGWINMDLVSFPNRKPWVVFHIMLRICGISYHWGMGQAMAAIAAPQLRTSRLQSAKLRLAQGSWPYTHQIHETNWIVWYLNNLMK